MKNKYTKQQLIDLAISNINSDREVAKELLEDVAEYIGEQKDRYVNVGLVAAKYLETLQRSNEQLVKLASLMKKDEQDLYGNLNQEDKEGLYSELENEDSNE